MVRALLMGIFHSPEGEVVVESGEIPLVVT